MQLFFTILLAPLTFAILFIWPLITQGTVALGLMESGWPAIIVGAAIALPLGLVAQIRGSWVWIK